MGIYLMVSVTMVCDNCGKDACKIYTSKRDIPAYTAATITCMGCIAKGFPHPGGSTGSDIDNDLAAMGVQINGKKEPRNA